MSELDAQKILTTAFTRLHREGFNLGVGEYLAALEAIPEWGNTLEDLQQLVRLLWCCSVAEQSKLEMIWESIVAVETPKPKIEAPPQSEPSKVTSQTEKKAPSIEKKLETLEQQPTQEFSPLPIQTPFTPIEIDSDVEFQNYWLISRRYMVYTWRYLRRPVANGAEDLLDIPATVEQVANQGFFLKPVYRRRETNLAHLLLLIDQEGSMTPFHRFTRDLVETAKYESDITQVDVGYFHNIPAEKLYQDPYLTEPVDFANLLSQCDSETRVLIVSDAGAARGYRRMQRVREITDVIFDIKQHTNLIAWLNPMPQERWSNTSAQILSYIVPMFPMNQEGLSQAINVA
ncbi:hypothetical protein NIES4071_86860 [Calothrix sp. NIES-4071]|nr:hypothetical protein NIES4071_86860 [Calothrix sp. NIES-4071]BAZ62953.1 hypothetical protein NIES4105_86790 [Calothrix sp. NIES-4105]